MTRGREQAQPEEWGVWEFGGPTRVNPAELKKGIRMAESGIKSAKTFVESDVSYAASRIRERVRKATLKLNELGAFPTHEVVVDGEKTTAQIIPTDMLGTYIDQQGIVKSFTHGTGEHEGLPILGSLEDPGDLAIINARGILMGALEQTLETFRSKHFPQVNQEDSDQGREISELQGLRPTIIEQPVERT